jgi:hypothetical protein
MPKPCANGKRDSNEQYDSPSKSRRLGPLRAGHP